MGPEGCNVAVMNSAWGKQRGLRVVDKAVVKYGGRGETGWGMSRVAWCCAWCQGCAAKATASIGVAACKSCKMCMGMHKTPATHELNPITASLQDQGVYDLYMSATTEFTKGPSPISSLGILLPS